MSKRSTDYIYRAKRADKNKKNRKGGGGVRKEIKINYKVGLQYKERRERKRKKRRKSLVM